ncbi:hypothetical protein EDD85DRAFT_798199 [Armillaria nabsnona]|nr:hypothetical protein EDD85DRAFT_798199 [Armillaria nabsnona]
MSSLCEHRQCPHCQKYFHVNGIGNHRKTCKQRIQQDVMDSQFNLETSQRQAAGMDHGATNTPMLLFGNQAPSSSAGLTSQFHDLHLDNQGDLSPSLSFESVSSEGQNPSSAPVTDATDQILDLVNSYNPKFVIEYHPRALLDPHILTCEEYFQMTAVEKTDSFVDNLNHPWHPFASKNDFELAEHILHTHLNREGRDGFFKVLKTQAGDHPSAFTINNDHDLKEAWSKAENLLTKIFDEPWTVIEFNICMADPEKGYPVVAHIANLPDAICNGKTWGGGTVVGWLPVIEDDSRHKGKPSWINFKRVVWHEAFRRIIQSVAEYSHTGYAFKLSHSGDIIVIYPFIFILSTDYEEQQQKKCKIFIIMWKKREKMFYKKLVYDLLKMYSGALLEVIHIKQFPGIEHLEKIPGVDKHAAKVAIDEFIANFPRWRNLMHFKNVTDFDFGDAKKFEHMSKVIRSYLELDMYASMDVHTEKSIEEGRHVMEIFDVRLKAYSPTTWKIPKVHTQQHLFDDIIAKGVTKNYNTKPNECMHGPLKKTYQTQTNFKDVAEQIHEKIDRQKKYQQEETDDLSEDKKNQYHQNQRIGALDSKAMLHSLKFSPKDPRTVVLIITPL